MDNRYEEMMNEQEEPKTSGEAPTPLPGLTATMEIAGAESIPNAKPRRIMLGFSRD